MTKNIDNIESHKISVKKYNKEKTTQIALRLFNNTDADIIEKLKIVPNKNGYIKSLIRDDIQNENKSN